MIRILAIGDVMGRPGRRCLEQLLGKAKETYEPDFILANGENSAGGFGMNRKVFDQLTTTHGIDAVTMGNHWMDKHDIHDLLSKSHRIVLPGNMENVQPETRGLRLITSRGGVQIAVMNLLGKTFMKGENRCPFATVDRLLEQIPASCKIRILDIHAEATSEKQGLGHFVAGRCSLVYGTHSHCPTADERILDEATGYITDLGMTGGYDSVIGIKKLSAIRRLRTGEKRGFEPSTTDLWLCAVVADLDEESGKCQRIERLRWRADEAMLDV